MRTSLKLLLPVFLPVVLGENWNVDVGADGQLAFNPQFLDTEVGDIITFNFHPKNHSVTQSLFESPCVPLNGGTDSGFMPVAADGGDPVTFNVTVQDKLPKWFYCMQGDHCGRGMVFAINPPFDGNPHTFEAFRDLAIATNGSSSATPPTTTLPPPVWASATATVTWNSSTYTTTYTSYDGTPPPTPAAEPQTITVIVGDNGLHYNPSNFSASIGDSILFKFSPNTNHTVTQSSFLHPCQSLGETSGTQGFKSGFKPTNGTEIEPPTFNITINTTEPIWGYCGQTNHCRSGMVFAINAINDGPNNFDAFLNLAKNYLNNTAPSNATTSVSSTAAPTTSTAKASPSNSGISNVRIGYGLLTSIALTSVAFMYL